MTGVEKILSQAGVPPADIGALLHGTTVSTNVVLEEKGAKVGLIVTRNFEQVLHMARSQTPGPLAGWMIMVKPDPLADLERTRGVPERIDARGEIVEPLDEESVRATVSELVEAGVESLTVSLVHSYANAAHEKRVAAIIRDMGVDLPVTLSSEILPEFREYERTLVAVMNAYVGPSMRTYLANFEAKLRDIEFSPQINILRSDGGLMSVARASRSPVHTMLSGPAGGVSGAAFVATLAGHADAMGFDMGGTSTDVSLIRDGKPTISQHRRRRRLHRPCPDDRRAARRARERRGRAGPGLLRPRRRAAHRHRRQPGAGAPAVQPARRRDGPRRRRGGSGDR